MANVNNPQFLLIPGGWHLGSLYQLFADELAELGYETNAITNMSVSNILAKDMDVNDDAEGVRKVVNSLIDQGILLVILTHSYGGIPGTTGTTGLTRLDRMQAGKPGGVIGHICISSLLCEEGVSIVDAANGRISPYIKVDSPEPGLCFVDLEQAEEAWYGPDCDPEMADAVAKKVHPQGYKTFTAPPGKPVWLDKGTRGRLAYIKCLRDQALPLDAQNKFIEMTGAKWHTVEMDTGHSPFMSQPKQLAKHVVDILKIFHPEG